MWEYKFEHLCHRGRDETMPGCETKTYTQGDIEKELNSLAREGWELVYFPADLLQNDNVEGFGIFRREKGFVNVASGYQVMFWLGCHACREFTWDELKTIMCYVEELELSEKQIKKIILEARDKNKGFSYEKFTSILKSIENYKKFLKE